MASVIAANDGNRRTDNSAHGNRITVSRAASVTDALRDIHANTDASQVPATSAVISIPIPRKLLQTSRPLCDGNNPPSFPRLVLSSNARIQRLRRPLALDLATMEACHRCLFPRACSRTIPAYQRKHEPG
jgi:hypothetical protein